MPKVISYADTQAGRRTFGRWLKSQIERSGKSKTSIVNHLNPDGENNLRRLNDYINGVRLPSEYTLEKLAPFCGTTGRAANLVAGYLRPIVRELPYLLAIARGYCDESQVDFGDCIAGVEVPMKQDDRWMNAPVSAPGKTDGKRFVVPWPAVSAVYLALAAFPLRGESYLGDYHVLDVNQCEYLPCEAPPSRTRLPKELSIAIRYLADSSLESSAKRSVAGEFVRSWIRKQCGAYALASEEAMYRAAPDVPTLPGSEAAMTDD